MAVKWDKNRTVASSILECIGRTPLLRLNGISEEVGVDVLGKLEFFSPTGSLKDRIYSHMIREAIKSGELKPGMKILESSTGNAGIACTFVGTFLGYEVTIVMPKGMSEERKKIIRAYGGKLIETPGGESDVDLCIEKVKELKDENPGVYWEPSQFSNPNNINAHYVSTGPEIWEQTGGKVGAFLASQGTGGALSGVGKYLKEVNPDVRLFAVEPSEAPLLSERKWGSHSIEGIGDGFVPRNLKLQPLTGIIRTTSQEAIEMARRLSLKEGLFCGISSGCNVAAALKLAKHDPDCGPIVTMINDTGQRYFSTPLCGEEKHLDIPERDHPMDDYTRSELDKYQGDWVIL